MLILTHSDLYCYHQTIILQTSGHNNSSVERPEKG